MMQLGKNSLIVASMVGLMMTALVPANAEPLKCRSIEGTFVLSEDPDCMILGLAAEEGKFSDATFLAELDPTNSASLCFTGVFEGTLATEEMTGESF